jgi:hypothetical protein
MKKIYFDFETTSPNPLEAEILEACFIFVEDREIIDRFESKIIINKPYEVMSILERETLEFNGILSKEDFISHNQQARHWEEFIDKVMTYYIEMFIDYEEKPLKLPLTGWNNSGFDNIILQRKLGVINGKLLMYKEWFDYHTRDIMHRFQILKECDMLKGLSLSKTHNDIIGKMQHGAFHTAYADCHAVKELDEWFEDHIQKEIQ